MRAATYGKLFEAVNRQIANKNERSSLVKEIKDQYVANLGEDHGFETSLIGHYYGKFLKT